MQPTPNPAFDHHMMGIALRMAQRGLGQTSPNPAVGAVIADEMTGEVIARGWTQPGGRPHAEKEALRRAGSRARGRTMYVTLEPCAHTGRIPTCADAMLSAGLARVVCAIADPNPVISGSGFAQLRAAGIQLDVGLMADQARWLTLGHIIRQTQHRPFVQLKFAVSADGRIAPGDGHPVWVTGPETRARGHLLRAEADTILVGIATVLADDPQLTCRLPGLANRHPDRVIFDSQLRTPPSAKALSKTSDKQRIWIASIVADEDPRSIALQRFGTRMLGNLGQANQAGAGDRVDLLAVLKALAAAGSTRVLVEGGPTIAASLLSLDLVDEVVVFRGVESLAPRGLPVAALDAIADRTRWHALPPTRLSGDTMTVYRRIARLITEDFA